MTASLLANPTLHLHLVQVPWVEYPGTLLLASPRKRRPVGAASGLWEREILEALLELRTKSYFDKNCKTQSTWELEAYSGRPNTESEGSLAWPGWQQVVLPFREDSKGTPSCNPNAWKDLLKEFGASGSDYQGLPTHLPATALDWPHDLKGTLGRILALLQQGAGVIYLDLEPKGTAAFLPAALAQLGDPTVHPHIALYPVSRLGLSPYQYGVLVGMGARLG